MADEELDESPADETTEGRTEGSAVAAPEPALDPRGDDSWWPVIDTSVAHEARMYDYLLGGDVNFAVDRAAAHAQVAVAGGMANARAGVQANRAFLRRAVQWTAGEAGVRQFLDIGTGIPNADHVHAVALETAPDARIVYVDHDPIVLAHAHILLEQAPEGAIAYLHTDLREPADIVKRARATLDFDRPVAVLLVSMLHFLADDDDPYGIVDLLVDALAPGSYLVISHLTAEIQPDHMRRLAAVVANNPTTAYQFHMRTHSEIARFFHGLELVEPGLVAIDHWRPETPEPPTYPPGVGQPPFYAAIGHKQ